jgi:hypothetical protein
MTTRVVDSKGRISLGARFANKTVIVEEIDETEIRIVEAVTVPVRELWLQRNQKAMQAVQAGLAQARAGKFSKKPSKRLG